MSRIVKNPEVRREELLKIGIQLLLNSKNPNALSIKDIVEKAEVATGLFYYYFESKDAFLNEAIDYYICQYIQQSLSNIDNDQLGVHERVILLIDDLKNHIERVSPVASTDYQYSSSHLYLERALNNQMVLSIKGLIEEGEKEGIYHFDDSLLTATFIINGLSSLIDLSIQNPEKKYQNQIRQLVFKLLSFSEKETV